MEKLNRIFEKNNKKLNLLSKQRRTWLYTTSCFFILVISSIFIWDMFNDIPSKTIWLVVISLMTIISINWWYWTMRTVKTMLDAQTESMSVITEILVEIKVIHENLAAIDNDK